MAYVSKERKQKISNDLKPILAKYNVKGTLSVHNHSTIVLTIQRSHLDFIGNYEEVLRNDHYRMNKPSYKDCNGDVVFDFKYLSITHSFQTEHFSGVCESFLKEAHQALNLENFDHSDSQTDYFHVGWYSEIKIGRWDKPYIFEGKEDLTPEQMIIAKEVKEEIRLNKLIDEGKLGCKIVEYSDKCLAVFGNTKPLKDKLKAIGAKFNSFLNDEGEKRPGWVISKTRESQLKELFN